MSKMARLIGWFRACGKSSCGHSSCHQVDAILPHVARYMAIETAARALVDKLRPSDGVTFDDEFDALTAALSADATPPADEKS